MSALATIGHNNPPGPTADASEAFAAVARFLADTPVVQTHDQANEATRVIKAAKGALDDLEARRDKQVRPLNDRVAEINKGFREVREPLQRLLDEIKGRLSTWIRAEEDKRVAAAAEARRKAAEAERLAREAEAKEAEAREDAAVGAFTDFGAASAEADEAFDRYQRASRDAARAEKDSKVRLTGGFGRAIGARNKTTLVLDDAAKAIAAIGVTEKIEAAILSAARDYKRLNSKLPAGVSEKEERGL